MRKTSVLLMIIFSCLLAYALSSLSSAGHAVEITDTAHTVFSPGLPFEKGESFAYEVRYNGLKVGKSTLTFNGEKELGGVKTYHVTFFTNTGAFKDTEEIYADKKTFLPIEVHRKIKKKIGFSDNILERYDQGKFRVAISSKSKLRKKEFSIQKDAPIYNAILLAYYYRAKDSFNKGDKIKITLPTIDFEVIYKGIEAIETKLGEYRTHAFTSDPPKFKLWLSADKKRIPLKIITPGALGYSLAIESIE